MSLPQPLTPSDVDLRALPYMPLDVVRLRDCDTAVMASAEGFRAAVMLWCASWHQVPAASIPKDDRTLAHLAGFGRDLASWQAVKEDALRGFVECADGRLYHPVIAEKALDSWGKRKDFCDRLEKARAAKAAKSVKILEPEARSNEASIIEPITEPETGHTAGHKVSVSVREGNNNNISTIPDNHLDGRSASPPAPRKAKRAKARTEIPEDAQPNVKDREAATEAGLDEQLFRSEWRKFRDYHRAKGSLMADWSAAWRTWVGNVPGFQRPNSRAGPSAPAAAPREPVSFLQAGRGLIDQIRDATDERFDQQNAGAPAVAIGYGGGSR